VFFVLKKKTYCILQKWDSSGPEGWVDYFCLNRVKNVKLGGVIEGLRGVN